MSDLLTRFLDFRGDWVFVGPDMAEDDGLNTAVIVSLFTDRRANPDDALPDGTDDRRGWWGDAFPDVDGDRIGSRLWLLSREKQLPSVLQRAQQYAEEALAWLVEDGIASAVNVVAETVKPDTLGLGIEIRRAGKPPIQFRFESFWNAAYVA